MAYSDAITAQYAALEARIAALSAAIAALATPGVTRYELDTGQSTQSVTRSDIGRLQDSLTGMLAQLEILEVLVNGGGVTQVVPFF